MGDSDYGYEFGGGEDELARLQVQGKALAPATRMIFAAAGIRAGMRVLDLGCSAGSLTLLSKGNAESRSLVTASTRDPPDLPDRRH